MTDQSQWKGTAEIIGLASVVVGLLLVFWELRQSHAIARAELNMASTELQSNLNDQEMDTEFSKVWVKSWVEPENLSLEEQFQVDAFLNNALVRMRRERHNYDLGIFEEWETTVSGIAPYYFGSDYGRAYWSEIRELMLLGGDADFVEVIDAALSNDEINEWYTEFDDRVMQRVRKRRQLD